MLKKASCFIDYRKAFDLISQSKLWYKVLSTGINGKVLNVIINLYNATKSYVKNGNLISPDSFPCNTGVLQGENLSPLLFAIYLNDFELYLRKIYKGLDTISTCVNNYLSDEDTEVFLRLYCLLYADDTIILAESPEDLQSDLNCVYNYCKDWNLTVNTSKTKVMIFSKGKTRNNPNFLGGMIKFM